MRIDREQLNEFYSERPVLSDEKTISNKPEIKEADEFRTSILEKIGYRILRFTNDEVIADTDNVRAITRKINGGYNSLEDRELYLVRAKSTLGVK